MYETRGGYGSFNPLTAGPDIATQTMGMAFPNQQAQQGHPILAAIRAHLANQAGPQEQVLGQMYGPGSAPPWR